MSFQKAVKEKAKLRLGISGPSGSGKTFTALRVASGFGGKIALVDSEHGSASKYADLFDFDVCELGNNKQPQAYINAIVEAEKDGYDILIIDSLTHCWDEVKKFVDKKTSTSNSRNSFNAWGEGTPLWESVLDKIMSSSIHIIVTMRAKTEYVQERDERGKTAIRKVGMAPEVRQGTEYIFDAVLDMTHEHAGSISKTRCHELDGYAEIKPSEELGAMLSKWLSDGVDAVPKISDRDKKINALLYRAGLVLTKEEIFLVLGTDSREKYETKALTELHNIVSKKEADNVNTNQ